MNKASHCGALFIYIVNRYKHTTIKIESKVTSSSANTFFLNLIAWIKLSNLKKRSIENMAIK
jgi:hypothetical protein